MRNRSIKPMFVIPGTTARQLERLPRIHKTFDEGFLQEMLAKHPELLPVSEMVDDVGSLLCIGREVSVSAGSIDNLYLSTAGYPVIVETKLWRNSEARREVLSQTLDYVKDVVKKDFRWFADQWELSNGKFGPKKANILEALNEISADEIDEAFITDRVNRALARGEVIALIVGDGIESRLQELVDHLCKDSPHLHYFVGLVELSCYQFETGDNGIIVVPRIIQEIQPVERAYVRIDFADGLEKHVSVKPIVSAEAPSTKPGRTILSEGKFLETIESFAGRDCRNQIQGFYTGLVNEIGLEPEFKAAALMLKVPHPDGDSLSVSVLAIEKQGRVYNTCHMQQQLLRWGFSETLVGRITSDYWGKLHAIDARFGLSGIGHMSPSEFLPFSELTRKLADIKRCIEEVVSVIRAECDKVQ